MEKRENFKKIAYFVAILILIGLNVLQMFFSQRRSQRTENRESAYVEIDNASVADPRRTIC